MNAFNLFIEGPLLTIVLVLFIVGAIYRFACFVYMTFRGDRNEYAKENNSLINFVRFFFPFHKGIMKKPFYGVLRYVFHLCLIIVPIWYSGHIDLWETSRLGWGWTALPDGLADSMTIVLIVLAILFLARRIASRFIRQNSSISDYFLILIAAIPFLTGYGLSHGGLEHPLRIIHVLSGELFLVVAIFLFVRAWFIKKRCTGCAACEVECPTGTLMSIDNGEQRTFTYNQYQCIDCGTCVKVCPEDAVELRHDISFRKLFNIVSKEKIRTVELSKCEGCNELFAPNPQIDKISGLVSKDLAHLCNKCKAKFNMEHMKGQNHSFISLKQEGNYESSFNQRVQ